MMSVATASLGACERHADIADGRTYKNARSWELRGRGEFRDCKSGAIQSLTRREGYLAMFEGNLPTMRGHLDRLHERISSCVTTPPERPHDCPRHTATPKAKTAAAPTRVSTSSAIELVYELSLNATLH